MSATLPVALALVIGGPHALLTQARDAQFRVIARTDFSQSAASDRYRVSGDVDWSTGHVTLQSGASLERPIDGGPWIRCTIAPVQSQDAESIELRVWFSLKDSTDCCLRLQRANDMHSARLALIDTDGEGSELIVREATQVSLDHRRLTIDYRYGLVTVRQDSKTLFSGFIENGSSAISAVKVSAVEGPLALSSLSISLGPQHGREPARTDLSRLEQADSHYEQMGAAYERGDYHEAASLARKIQKVHEEILGARSLENSTSLNNIGFFLELAGDVVGAADAYQRAREIRREVLGDGHPEYSTSLNNLGYLYAGVGDSARARLLYEDAIRIEQVALGEGHPAYATSLDNLAAVCRKLGDHDRAESLFRQAMEIRRDALGRQHPEFVSSLNNLGVHLTDQRQFDEAERLLREALRTEQTLFGEAHPRYGKTLSNLALVLLHTDRRGEAEGLYEQAAATTLGALGSSHPDYAKSLANLGICRHLSGQTTASESLSQSNRLAHDFLEFSAIALSERQQRRSQAQFRFALDARLSDALDQRRSAAAVIADVWRWKGSVTRRQQAYRQLGSNEALTPLFQQLQAVSQRASVLLARTPLPPPASAPKAAQQQYNQDKTAWERSLRAAFDQREKLEERIAGESRDFRTAREPITVDLVRKWLPEDTALVDYLQYTHRVPFDDTGRTRSERRFLAFVVTRNAPPVIVGLGAADRIEESITAFREALVSRELDPRTRQTAQEAGAEVRARLWTPLEEHLGAQKTVLISPDTVLGTLPFGALPNSAGRFLIEDYRLAMIPTAARLRTVIADEPAGPNTGLLVVGDIEYGRSAQPDSEATGWSALPGFRKELDVVRDIYRARFQDGATVLSGARATEDEFLRGAARAGTLHVITHGYFDPPSDGSTGASLVTAWMPGLLSGLVMAGANAAAAPQGARAEDGILRSSEIEAAPLKGVDLVVLSACETGLGAVAGGEGLTGLQRAFQVAGARTVVASLWKVDDSATLALMTEFYRNLWEKRMGRLDALREAQLAMLRHYDADQAVLAERGERRKINPAARPSVERSQRLAPRFWAAFQLSGDWR